MNTHDIELPPLPKASEMYDIPGYDEEELKDYARAAIEADRKRRGEPVAWGAFYFGGKRNGKLYNHTETEAQIDAYIADVHRSNDSITLRKGPLYTAPQPLSESDIPAEPDSAKCAECGAEMIHVRPGKWQHPDCSQSPWTDEPVGYIMPSAIKQLKAGGNAIVGGVSQGGDVAVYLAPQPAEHNIDYKQLYEQMCNRCDSLDAKLAEYERRGEPVYLYRRKGRDEFVTCDKSRYDELSSKPDHFETKVLYTAPQPAEPVKVPSDAEIIALALSSGIRKSEEHWGDRYYTEVGSSLIGFARALLARYSKGTP